MRTHILFSSYFIFSNLLLPVIFTWRKPENLVTLLSPRGRRKGQETAFSFSFIVYRETFVWGLRIGFRGVSSPGSECIYIQKVQYSCICLKIPEIVVV